MTNPYEAPRAVLESGSSLIRKKTGWKIFFWIFFLLVCFSFWLMINNSESSNFDKLGEVITYTLMGVGLFGFAYNKKIIRMHFWRYFIPCAIVWDVYNLTGQDWSLFSEGNIVAYVLIGITLSCLGLLLFFQYFALYKYAFQSQEIWGK